MSRIVNQLLTKREQMNRERTVESQRTEIEKMMMGLDPKRTEMERRMYIGGFLDASAHYGIINEEVRGILYAEFVG
jgi:hypothetical protein